MLNRLPQKILLILLGILAPLQPVGAFGPSEPWKVIGVGVEYAAFSIRPPAEQIEGKLHVVRLNPNQVAFKMLLASELDQKSRTAAEWCGDYNLAVAINAGMFQKDLTTNVGYLRNGTYLQNPHWNKYKSVFTFYPRKNGLPQATVVDLDTPHAKEIISNYNSAVQNLRLIKGKGINVWARSEKKWSEAAMGMDGEGRILLLFCPQPYTMWDFIEAVIALGLGIEYLMHLEGGALASLSIRTKELSLDLAGVDSFLATSRINKGQWPVPNVIGIQLN